MSTSVAVEVTRMHAVLVVRPRSGVFHVASRADVTDSGRYLRRSAKVTCSARTRRLVVLRTVGVAVDLGGRRMCSRCAARLRAIAGRAVLPVPLPARKVLWRSADISSLDLVTGLAVATTSDETHALSSVTDAVFDPCNTTATRRPTTPGKAQGRWDFEALLLKTRTTLRLAERPEDEVAAARTRKEMQDDESERARLSRIRAHRDERYQHRVASGKYTTRWERDDAAKHA